MIGVARRRPRPAHRRLRGRGRPSPEQELIDHVAAQLSVHKRPREVRFVDRAAAQRDGQGPEGALAPDRAPDIPTLQSTTAVSAARQPSRASTASGSLSARNWRQRAASSCSPIVAAARPSACSERRKPWFGSCDHGIGPCALPAGAAQRVEAAVVSGAGVGVGLDRAPVGQAASASVAQAALEAGYAAATVGRIVAGRQSVRRPVRRAAGWAGRADCRIRSCAIVLDWVSRPRRGSARAARTPLTNRSTPIA